MRQSRKPASVPFGFSTSSASHPPAPEVVFDFPAVNCVTAQIVTGEKPADLGSWEIWATTRQTDQPPQFSTDWLIYTGFDSDDTIRATVLGIALSFASFTGRYKQNGVWSWFAPVQHYDFTP